MGGVFDNMSEKMCDHTSVGMLILNQANEVLLIERKKPPFGWAAPAGHVDGDPSFEVAAARELQEEVGLSTVSSELVLDERIDNPCRRVGGSWHHWKVYRMNVTGKIEQSKDEVKDHRWTGAVALRLLLEKTQSYENGEMTAQEWETDPGIEPVWRYIFEKVNILQLMSKEEAE
jgi:ADP-ribose pyrophosphatase YjhB (NUDIX family)